MIYFWHFKLSRSILKPLCMTSWRSDWPLRPLSVHNISLEFLIMRISWNFLHISGWERWYCTGCKWKTINPHRWCWLHFKKLGYALPRDCYKGCQAAREGQTGASIAIWVVWFWSSWIRFLKKKKNYSNLIRGSNKGFALLMLQEYPLMMQKRLFYNGNVWKGVLLVNCLVCLMLLDMSWWIYLKSSSLSWHYSLVLHISTIWLYFTMLF